MKNIVFFQYPWRLWRNRLRGVYRYAEKADWRVQVVEYGRTALTVHIVRRNSRSGSSVATMRF